MNFLRISSQNSEQFRRQSYFLYGTSTVPHANPVYFTTGRGVREVYRKASSDQIPAAGSVERIRIPGVYSEEQRRGNWESLKWLKEAPRRSPSG